MPYPALLVCSSLLCPNLNKCTDYIVIIISQIILSIASKYYISFGLAFDKKIVEINFQCVCCMPKYYVIIWFRFCTSYNNKSTFPSVRQRHQTAPADDRQTWSIFMFSFVRYPHPIWLKSVWIQTTRRC